LTIPIAKVEIGFDLDNADATVFTLDDDVRGLLDNDVYLLGGTIFFDVTNKVKSVSVRRGKNRQLDEFDAGLANIVFDNNDRTFDPTFAGSPFAGQIIPKRAVRISSYPGLTTSSTNTNSITNPSFEGQSTTTVTNLITNPSFEANTTSWVTSGGTVTRITTDSVFGSACANYVATANNHLVFIDSTATPSTTYTFSGYVKGESGKSYRLNIEERTGLAGVGSTASANITANGSWQRVSVTRTFGATGVIARTWVQNATVGAHQMLIDGAMLTVGAVTEPYFDGNSTANDTTFVWTGTADNSASTRACNALVVARTNLMPNPNFELNSTQWAAARLNRTLDSTTFLYGSQALKGTVNSTTAQQYLDHGSRVSVTAGLTYTASAYVFLPATNTGSRSITAQFFPHTGSAFLAGKSGTAVTIPTGQWSRIFVSAVMPATATSVMLRIIFTSTAALNDVIIIDGVMIEESSAVGEYFDGNNLPSGDYVYDWSGVVGLSASRQEVRQITGSSFSQNAAAGMSRAWDSSRIRSLVVAPTRQNNDSHIRFSISGLTSGVTYTAMAKCYLSAPLTGTLNARSRQLSAWNSTFTLNVGSITATNTAGIQDLRFTFTANDTTMILALHNGASVNNGLVWFDDFALINGDYDGEFFDGNNISENYKTYSWQGTPDASTSVRVFNAELAGRIFTGVIDDWNLEYEPNGNSDASAAASDAFTLFNTQTMPGGTATAQTTSERLNAVLDFPDVSWSQIDRNFQVGQTALGTDVFPENGNVLNYMRQVANSEPGNLYMGKSGALNFTNRTTASGSLSVIFADDGTGIGYTGMRVVYGSELLFNEIVLGSQAAGTVVATDANSINEYGVLNLTQNDLLLSNPDYLANLAIFYAIKFSEPEYRFESVDVTLNDLGAESQATMLGIEISDFVTVRFTPNGIAPAIERIAQVIRIDHDITPSEHIISLGFSTVDTGFFTLSDPIFGRLSTGNVLGF
jgi:hypothetical protein